MANLSLGWGQAFALLACGPFFVEGWLLTLLSISEPARDQWPEPWDGFLLFAAVLGLLLGNLMGGLVADVVGRQCPILVSCGCSMFFGIMSGFASNELHAAGMLVLLGLSVGLAEPAAVSLINEVVPSNWQVLCTGCTSLFFSLGAVTAAGAASIHDAQFSQALPWHNLLGWSALPSGVFGFLSIFLLAESPAFLASSGDHASARDALQHIYKLNQIDLSPHDCAASLSQMSDSLAGASTRPLSSKATVYGTSVVLSFALYGASHAAPPLLAAAAGSSQPLLYAVFLAVLVALLVWGRQGDFGYSSNYFLGLCLLLSMTAAFFFAFHPAHSACPLLAALLRSTSLAALLQSTNGSAAREVL